MDVGLHLGQARRIGFIDCHLKRMAILISRPGGDLILRGLAVFQTDRRLGPILRISIDGGGDGNLAKPTDILIQESAFDGLIEAESRYGCDYCLTLHADVNARPTEPERRTPTGGRRSHRSRAWKRSRL